MGLVGFALLFLVAVPMVGAVRHHDESPVAAYLVFAVTFSALSALVFFMMVGASQRWPEAAASNFVLSPTGILLLSIVPAYALGLWLASLPPYRSPHVE